MKRLGISIALAGILILAFSGSSTQAGGAVTLTADLSGFQEVTPKITNGSGTFTATIMGDTINFEMTYADLSAPASASHIHLGQFGVNGGVFAFLCGGSRPACPGTGGTVTGTITAEDIRAITDQGLVEGDFDSAVRALLSGSTYVNIHTSTYPGGEIRGQIAVSAGSTE